MKQFGSFSELVSLLFRKNSQAITLEPNQATTYTASRAIQTAPEDANSVLVSETATQTLTNKTLTSPTINGATGISKADVGLGNVDNTSDATKNAATATLTNKTLTAPVINSPTGITKSDVGLSNVDNTSDATKNSATATLTNKTLTAAEADLFLMDNQTTPGSNPASGKHKLYVKADHSIYTLDSSGVEHSGSGGVTTVGAFGSVDAKGLVITGSQIVLTEASEFQPGGVNITTQGFAGIKTFVDGIQPSSGSDVLKNFTDWRDWSGTTTLEFIPLSGPSAGVSAITINHALFMEINDLVIIDVDLVLNTRVFVSNTDVLTISLPAAAAAPNTPRLGTGGSADDTWDVRLNLAGGYDTSHAALRWDRGTGGTVAGPLTNMTPTDTGDGVGISGFWMYRKA